MPHSKLPKGTMSRTEVAAGTNKNSPKKYPAMDDFVMTISDSDSDVPDLDSDDSKVETIGRDNPITPEVGEVSKRGKKRKRSTAENGEEENKKKDGGGLDSDFEFMCGGEGGSVGEYDGWGFEGAREAMRNGRAGVDVDDIIRRRRGGEEEEETGDEEEVEEETGSEEGEVEFAGLESDDEDLALDGFGMGAVGEHLDGEHRSGSGKDSYGDEEDEGSEEEGEDSEDESVASIVPHPEDEVSDDDSEEEDAEEVAKKAAFFAPEEEDAGVKSSASVSFQQMNLSRPILRGLVNVGFNTPTLIQRKTIPVALLGKDVVGGAVTGSGKTAAFIVPILERLLFRPKKVPISRVVILCPTRELAMQAHSVALKLAVYTDIKFALAVGGLSLKVQEAELKKRPDVIIATPGRFIDHMRNSQGFSIESIEIVVMDEADRMLEDGFADELNEIINAIPKSRQTMLFSATMTDSVDKLIRLSLQRPVRIMVDTKLSTVKTLVQEFVRIRPQREHLRLAMLVFICREHFTTRTIVFFRSKVFAHRVRVVFGLFGLKAAELHGSLSQEQRVRAVESFRDGKADFLLATDLASRGLDIKGVDVVINYEAPQSHEIYLHRVGRTARAGRQGRAVTLAAEADRKVVKAAVRAAQSQSAKVVSRILDVDKVDALGEKIKELDGEIEEILKEEKEEKQLQSAELQLRRGENLIKHEDEIKSRPKRTWFETQREKELREKVSKAQLNGLELPEKKGKLSNKKRKKLEGRGEVEEGRVYKKTKTDRTFKRNGGGKGGGAAKGGALKVKGKGGKKFAQKMVRGKGKSK
ncbi:P-loop containing nucleoside triphosphate hydrolase protein [Tuber indicum]|nr:P-loop containing nucleoside triphosphate hydrolase protein [Tuber indicum]